MIKNMWSQVPPIPSDTINSKPKLFNKKRILVSSLLIILSIVVGASIFISQKPLNPKIENGLNTDGELIQKNEFPIEEKEVPEEMLVYTDKEAGFTLKYPGTVGLNGAEGSSGITLDISAEKLSDIPEDLPLSMGRKDAINEKNRLQGNPTAMDVKIGTLYGSTEMVLSRFEVCSIILSRSLTFYPNDYRVLIHLSAPKDKVIAEMPEFFTKDPKNCGDMYMWKPESSTNFQETLSRKEGKGIAQKWYDTFDAIVNSVSITFSQKPTPDTTKAPTYLNAEYGFGLIFESPYRALEDNENLSGYPNAIALIYNGGQAYDIIIEAWDSKEAYEKAHTSDIKDLTVHKIGNKFITLFDMTKAKKNKEIIDSFQIIEE